MNITDEEKNNKKTETDWRCMAENEVRRQHRILNNREAEPLLNLQRRQTNVSIKTKITLQGYQAMELRLAMN